MRSTQHGIVHAGFRGFRVFVARKKVQCKLIRNRFEIPHDTILSTVIVHIQTKDSQKKFLKKNDFKSLSCARFLKFITSHS